METLCNNRGRAPSPSAIRGIRERLEFAGRSPAGKPAVPGLYAGTILRIRRRVERRMSRAGALPAEINQFLTFLAQSARLSLYKKAEFVRVSGACGSHADIFARQPDAGLDPGGRGVSRRLRADPQDRRDPGGSAPPIAARVALEAIAAGLRRNPSISTASANCCWCVATISNICVMIGGPNDVLVESGIVRVEPREARAPRSSEAGRRSGAAARAGRSRSASRAGGHRAASACSGVVTGRLLRAASAGAASACRSIRCRRTRWSRHPLEPRSPKSLAPESLAPEPRTLEPVPAEAPLAAPPPAPAPSPERPASRFPLPPRVGPSLRTPSFPPPPRFTPANPAGAPGEPAAKPRFVMPPLARRAPPPAEPARMEPSPPSGEPPSAPLSPAESPLPVPPPRLPAAVVAAAAAAPDAAAAGRSRRPPEPAPEPPAEPETQTRLDPDFEPLESLEEEMAKLLGRPLNK